MDINSMAASTAARSGLNQNQMQMNPEEEDDDTGVDEADGPRKRKRADMPISCELCQQRKVKCDRGKPKCGWCTRNDQECVYKERRKPGLRAGYGRELEQRLERLEEIVQHQQEEIAELRGRSIAQSSILQQVSSTSSPLHAPTSAPPATVGPSYGSPSIHGHDSYPSALSPPVRSPVLTATGSHSRDNELPPEDMLINLTELFFKHVNSWCPILIHKRIIDELFSPSQSGLGDESNRILMHAIICASLRFSNDNRLAQLETRERLYEESKKKVLLYGFEYSTVKSVQALVILAIDLLGSSTGQPVRNLLAMATRSMLSMGLSEEFTGSQTVTSIYTLRAVSLNDPPDWIEEESRRRLFWCLYFLDRYSTVPTALSFAFDDTGLKRRLPCRDAFLQPNGRVETDLFGVRIGDWYRGEYLGWYGHFTELVGVLTRIHTFLKKTVDITVATEVQRWRDTYRDLDRMLNAWEAQNIREENHLPYLLQNLGDGKENGYQVGWAITHAAHQLNIMRLHSSAAYPATTSSHFYPSYTASQRCLQAATRVRALADFATASNILHFVGPTFGFTVWVAARVMLVHGATVERSGLNPDVRILIETLEQMGRYWRQCERYSAILRRVTDEYNAHGGEGGEGEAMKVMRDMRRTAYDLDYLISRVPQLQNPRISGDPRGGVRTLGTGQSPVTAGIGSGGLNGGGPGAGMSGVSGSHQNQGGAFMDYVDTFDFFNMPMLPPSVNVGEGGLVNTMGSEMDFAGFGINAGGTDWLTS